MVLRGDSVILIDDLGRHPVLAAMVDSVWAKRGSRAKLFGLIAGIPCAILGAMVGAFLATDPDSNGRPGRAVPGALLGAAVAGLGCGAGGAAIGSLIRPWRLEFARS